MGKQFKGRTEDAGAPFLGADFWRPGVKVLGKVIRCFESANGLCAVLRLTESLTVNGEASEEVSIGNLDLTGFFCTKWILSHSTWYKKSRSGQLHFATASVMRSPVALDAMHTRLDLWFSLGNATSGF